MELASRADDTGGLRHHHSYRSVVVTQEMGRIPDGFLIEQSRKFKSTATVSAVADRVRDIDLGGRRTSRRLEDGEALIAKGYSEAHFVPSPGVRGASRNFVPPMVYRGMRLTTTR